MQKSLKDILKLLGAQGSVDALHHGDHTSPHFGFNTHSLDSLVAATLCGQGAALLDIFDELIEFLVLDE